MQVTIESIQSCPGWQGSIIHVGDKVWTPAGSSDPAAGKVVAIVPVSWPTIPQSVLNSHVSLIFTSGITNTCFP